MPSDENKKWVIHPKMEAPDQLGIIQDPAQYPNWRKFVVSHSDRLSVAQQLIQEAYSRRVAADGFGANRRFERRIRD